MVLLMRVSYSLYNYLLFDILICNLRNHNIANPPDLVGLEAGLALDNNGYSWKNRPFIDLAKFSVHSKKIVNDPKIVALTGISCYDDMETLLSRISRLEGIDIYFAGLGRSSHLTLDFDFLTDLGKNWKSSQVAYYRHQNHLIDGKLQAGEFKAWQYNLEGAYVNLSARYDNVCCISPCELCFKSTGRPTGYILMTLLVGNPCMQLHGILYVEALDKCIRVRLPRDCLSTLWTNPNVAFEWDKALRLVYALHIDILH